MPKKVLLVGLLTAAVLSLGSVCQEAPDVEVDHYCTTGRVDSFDGEIEYLEAHVIVENNGRDLDYVVVRVQFYSDKSWRSFPAKDKKITDLKSGETERFTEWEWLADGCTVKIVEVK